jgi:hypothetical protein
MQLRHRLQPSTSPRLSFSTRPAIRSPRLDALATPALLQLTVDASSMSSCCRAIASVWSSARTSQYSAPRRVFLLHSALHLSPSQQQPLAPCRQYLSRLRHACRPRRFIFQLHATGIGIRSSLSCLTLQVSNSSSFRASSRNTKRRVKTKPVAWCSPNTRQKLEQVVDRHPHLR